MICCGPLLACSLVVACIVRHVGVVSEIMMVSGQWLINPRSTLLTVLLVVIVWYQSLSTSCSGQ